MTSVMNETRMEGGERLSIMETAFHEIMEMKPDPRVEDWFLMSSVWPTAIICATYVFVVKGLGPWMMRDREPFELRKILIVYNGIQVILSAWLLSKIVGPNMWFGKYSFTCEPVDYSRSEVALEIAATCWFYYMSKFGEFFDTLFFVLRKKDRHISTLHVFHHGMMPTVTWFYVKYVPGGHTTFPGLLNTFVHVVMYSYYMVAAFGPAYEKYLWWKKYLTFIQLIQFSLVVIHNIQLLASTSCPYPKGFSFIYLINSLIFLSMFSNFYQKSYRRKTISKDGQYEKRGSSNFVSPTKKLKSG